jgi:hypothetical protein
MTRFHRLALALALSALAGAAAAGEVLRLGDLTGDWQGSGTFTSGDTEPGRIRCKIGFASTARGTTVVDGRCASSEGSDVFGLEISAGAGSAISAANRMEPPATLPPLLIGTLEPDGLQLQGEGIATLALRRDGEALMLTIVSGLAEKPGRMDVRLLRALP